MLVIVDYRVGNVLSRNRRWELTANIVVVLQEQLLRTESSLERSRERERYLIEWNVNGLMMID